MCGVPVLPAIYGESLSYMEVQGKMQYQINELIDNQEEFDERLGEAESDIDSLEERMGTAEGDIDAVEERMGTAEGDIDAVEERMGTAEGDIDALEERMGTAEGDIDAVENNVPKNYTTVLNSISVEDGQTKVIGYVDLHTGVDNVSSLFTCTLNYLVNITNGYTYGTVVVNIKLDNSSVGEFELTYFNGGMRNECVIVPVDMQYAGNHIVEVVMTAENCTLS